MCSTLPLVSLNEISSFLSEEILLELVQIATKNDKATISSYKVGYATSPGESYLGIVYRITVEALIDHNKHFVSMIAKGMPRNLARRKTWKIPSFFRNEVLFYETVLPILSDFEERKRGKQAQDEQPFLPVPKCLRCFSDGENDFIIMSDLGVEGFTISERTEGFDLRHIEAALKLLGHFHGLSLAMKYQEKEAFQNMVSKSVEPYYCLEYESWYSGFLKNLQAVTIDAVAREYPNSEFEHKIKVFANENQYKLMCELVKPTEPYAVPSHGDAWGPNFLFRYNSEDKSRPDEVRFLDFQLFRYASPVLDVLFFLFSVTVTDQRNNGGYEKLLRIYYDALTYAISELGSDPEKIFSYDNLQSELKKYGKYGLGMAMESVPLSMTPSNEISDLDSIPGNDEAPLGNYWKVSLIDDKEARLRLADLVKFAVEQNYI